ncbi:hypothetical protein [Dactylosporangium darangshiense]|uniref:Uncharacterized protein n=1 Tax=Dactylosporangium darangshiense TaxID=579108 RepID=A0ABP8DWJ0_9ACTN
MTIGFSSADLVWNRGLSDEPGTGVGDRHLFAMSKPHSEIMSSGTGAVTDGCTTEEILFAADAFDYFGLPELAALTRRLIDRDQDDWEHHHTSAFYGLEYALHPAFERRYRLSPEDFDPVALPEGYALDEHGPASCPGTLIVHQTSRECTLGADCARLHRGYLEHDGATLHRAAGCELCPSGPDWPN